jgi:chemotaxis protein methyltransferase CheR
MGRLLQERFVPYALNAMRTSDSIADANCPTLPETTALPHLPGRPGAVRCEVPQRIALLGQNCNITDQEFQRIRELIYREAGISLSESKRALVCSRLAKRLRLHRLANHTEYLDFLATRDPDGTELQVLVNCLTTNKTDFFREPHHFEFLREVVFPQIQRLAERGHPRRLRIWSAGCSRGHEPYSIAITIREHFGSLRGWDMRILASDINTEVLDAASKGIYPLDQIDCVDPLLRQKYFLRGSGEHAGECQVRPEVRRMVTFRQINLMERPWPIQSRFDVIFCRNVIIYFDTATQRALTIRLADQLAENGYLMLGHSEHPTWLGEVLTARGQTVYQRKRGGASSVAEEKPSARPTAVALVSVPKEPAPPAVPTPAATVAVREIISGQYFATKTPTRIATVLGSCVAACLYDPQTQIGGMNHFMLPDQKTDFKVCARYGIHAMELLINEIMKLGGDRRRLQAKVFGGASLLGFSDSPWNVANRNCEFVRDFLQTERIPVVAQRLGGNQPLRVYFRTDTAKVLVKVLHNPGHLLERERAYRQQLADRVLHPQTDNVTLF